LIPERPDGPLYPEAKKRSLSSDNSEYGMDHKAKGPKMGDIQSKSLAIGLVIMVVFGGLMIAAFIGAF
jgi:hypothetical protein